MPDIAFALRMAESETAAAIGELRSVGLIDATPRGLMWHNWEKRQFQADSSKERTQAWRDRKRHRDGRCDVTVSPPGDVTTVQPGDVTVTESGDVTVTPPEQIQNRNRTDQNRPPGGERSKDTLSWQAFCVWAACG